MARVKESCEVAQVPVRMTINAAAESLGVDRQTVWRWMRVGLKARNGQVIRLQHLRLGGRLFIRQEWLDEFGRVLAEADLQHFDRVANGHPLLKSHAEAKRALRQRRKS